VSGGLLALASTNSETADGTGSTAAGIGIQILDGKGSLISYGPDSDEPGNPN
jgi:type 1 fimbria pilin